jgi:sugar lactone lactonase YvrE
MRHISAVSYKALCNYFASTWRLAVCHASLIVMTAFMTLYPTAHAFVTAADFNGLESRIESNNMESPLGVAVDGNGNVYIAQSNGVLKETSSPDHSRYSESVVVRIQGIERAGIAVDGVGNVYLGIAGGVYKETPFNGGYHQSTIISNVKQPNWIAVDARGNVYIADNAEGRVLKETPLGDHYAESVVFSSAMSSTNSLNGLAVDAIGNVYLVSDGRVWKAEPTANGYQLTLALAGTYGRGLAVDGAGDLYVTVGDNQVLHETRSEGRYTQSTVATAHLPIASGLAVDYTGNLYVGDPGGNRVLKEYATSSAVQSPDSGMTGSFVSILSAPSGRRMTH